MIDHVARIATAVPPEAQAVAWLHDVLELTRVDPARLRSLGLTALETTALDLLTRRDGESYEAYVTRITDAPGPAGWMARTVKLADLEDHLAHSRIPRDAPPYAWARRRVLEHIGSEPATAVASFS